MGTPPSGTSFPGLTVSTDIIVGFPGETDADFEATLDVVREAQFDSAFMFVFSPRPGTAAAGMEDEFVDDDVIQERFQRLLALQSEIGFQRNRDMIGDVVEVLSEGPSKKDPEATTTRTRGGKLVHVPGVLPEGAFATAEIVDAAKFHLAGRLV